jgi:hypothetical protein
MSPTQPDIGCWNFYAEYKIEQEKKIIDSKKSIFKDFKKDAKAHSHAFVSCLLLKGFFSTSFP